MSIQRWEPAQDAPREWIALLPPAVELAKAVANTDFVPEGLRGNAAAITACVLYGDEVGLAPMQSLAHIAVIDGRPSMSAEAMRGLVLAAGHDLWVEEATNTRVTVAGRRKDSDQSSRVTWTMDDAKRANLHGKMNWRKYPRQMLIARATAELARAIFADAIGGLVAIEELDDGGEAAAEKDAPETGSRRRRRAALAPVSAPPAEGPVAPAPPLPGEQAAPEPGPTHDAAEAHTSAESETSAGAGLGANAPAPSGATDTLADDANESLRKRLMATYRERGFDNRDAMIGFARFIVGRPIESRNDLTPDEAIRIIDALERHGAGPAA